MPIKQLLIITILIAIITMGPLNREHHSAETINDCPSNASEIKEQITKIKNKEDTKTIMGNNYKEVIGEMYNNSVWRYDICPKSGYQNEFDYDIVDMEGLVAGEVNQIVFISFAEDGETIISKSMFYLDNKRNIHAVKFINDRIQDEIVY